MGAHAKKMRRLFRQADTSNDGYLNLEEFRRVLSDPAVRLWLASMDMESGDAERLFVLIDNGDGLISADELIAGVARLKGGARSIDLAMIINELRSIHNAMLAAAGGAPESHGEGLLGQFAGVDRLNDEDLKEALSHTQ